MPLSTRVIAAALLGSALLTFSGCAPVRVPGMVVSRAPLSVAATSGASTAGAGEPVTVLVAFPVTACTGTESAIFLDEEGRFVGAVAPGTGASLAVRAESKHLFVVSSSDVTAPLRASFLRHEVARRADQGVIVEVTSADAHNCKGRWSGPLEPRPESVSLAAATEAARGVTWLEVQKPNGDRWLDEHRERVDELVGRARQAPPAPQPVVTTVQHP